LRHPKLAGIEHLPVNLISEILELTDHSLTIIGELALGETLNVFQHNRGRAYFPYEAKRFGEEVTLIQASELTPCDRERRARHSACQEVYSVVLRAV
jgi:hypothetical protein